MLRLTFSAEIIAELEYWRYYHPHPHPRVHQKMEVSYLKAKGLSNQPLCELAGICPNTLRNYFKQYLAGRIPALQSWQVGGDHSELEQHTDTLETYFRQHPAVSLKQAIHKIEELTGLKRSPKQVGVFLKKLGIKRLKSPAVSAKFDEEEQTEFKTHQLEPGLTEATAGLREVFFVDAAHFV